VTGDLTKGVALSGIGQTETQTDHCGADEANEYGVDRSIGELDGKAANQGVSTDAAVGHNLNRKDALSE
jgi:hypothetical protein